MTRKIDAFTAYSLFLFIIALYTAAAFRFPAAYVWATYEDLLGEWSQFYFFVIALLFSARLAMTGPRFRPFFAALALACFYVAGEEISWGQRLFNIATPDFFRAHNLQQETNLHNFFTGPSSTLLKRGIETLLACSFISYGVIYPAALAAGRQPARWLSSRGIPAPPAYLWPFFAGAALLELRLFTFNEAEIAEILLALALAIMTCHYWFSRKHQGTNGPPPVERQAWAMALILAAGITLAGATISICASVPRLHKDMNARIDSGMAKCAERYGSRGNWRNAAALYRLLLAKDPRNTAMLRDLAACYRQMGEEEKFREINSRAIFIDMTKYGRFPDNIETNLSLHKTLAQAGRPEQAQFHLRKALQAGKDNARLAPDSASAAYWLGKSYLAAGDTAAALRQLEKAVRLQPQAISYRKALQRLTMKEQDGAAPAPGAGTGG